MTPEDKEEVKQLIDQALQEQEQIISPLFNVLWVYKDVSIPEGTDDVVADVKIEEAETIKVNRLVKWSDLSGISETSKKDRDLFEVRNLFRLKLNTDETMYCVIKDIDLFKKDWEEFILGYGAI